MQHISIIQDSFGQYYRVCTPDNGAVRVRAALEPERFRDRVLTEQFVRRLNVPVGYWRRILSGFSAVSHDPKSTDEKRVSLLLIQGTIKLYRVKHLDKQTQKSATLLPFPKIPSEKNQQQHQLVPASLLLVKPALKIKAFSNKSEATDFLSGVSLDENQLEALNVGAHQSERSIKNETLAQALLDRTVIAVLHHESAATRKSADAADVNPEAAPGKPHSLGPHEEGYAESSPQTGQESYDTTPMNSSYTGENDSTNEKRWNKPEVVEYVSTDQRKDHIHVTELEVRGGLLVNKHTGIPFDTSTADTWWGGGAMFVMDGKGNLVASNYQEPYEFHHSSLLAGAPAAAAGMIDVSNGVILSVSNKSGHYEPSQEQITEMLKGLQNKGIAKEDMDKIVRGGYLDDGSYLDSISHGDLTTQGNVNTKKITNVNSYISADWMK